jgi:hypothetical protein
VQAGKIFNNDRQELVWPASFRKAGKYQVQVRSEHGGSELRTVEVVAPPPVYAALSESARENKDTALIRALATPTPDFTKLKTSETAAARARVKPTPTPGLSRLKIQ